MHYSVVDFYSPWILKIYALRQAVLREPLGLNLFKEDLLDERNEIFVIAHLEETLISTMQFVNMGEQRLKLRQMATDPAFHGRGYGRQLVLFGEKWAKENHFALIELHARHHAVGFYKKIGYEIIGAPFDEVGILHYKMQKTIQQYQTE